MLEFCEKKGLIKYAALEPSPRKPFAFLHAKLTEESKKAILKEASNGSLKILIATNSAGCGINLNITKFLGWGLDPQPSGIIQAGGRTGRQPILDQCPVVWVHNATLHGRRVPVASQVRDLLKTDQCLRKLQNGWFSHGQTDREINHQSHLCCSNCMKNCRSSTGCVQCSNNLELYSKDNVVIAGLDSKLLTQFLVEIKLNEVRNESNYLNEKNLAKEIIAQLLVTPDVEHMKQFISIFSLRNNQSKKILDFLKKSMSSSVVLLQDDDVTHHDVSDLSETSESDISADTCVDEDEYYDDSNSESGEIE